jgi:hypothetical protein
LPALTTLSWLVLSYHRSKFGITWLMSCLWGKGRETPWLDNLHILTVSHATEWSSHWIQVTLTRPNLHSVTPPKAVVHNFQYPCQ